MLRRGVRTVSYVVDVSGKVCKGLVSERRRE